MQAAASSRPADCLPRLHQWLTEQAREPLSERLLCALDFEATTDLRTLDVRIVPGNCTREDAAATRSCQASRARARCRTAS